MADFDPVSYMMGQKAAGPSGGSSALSGLTDVDISNPTNGQVLVYNSATGKWENGAGGGGGVYMIDTSDLDTITIDGQTYAFFEFNDSIFHFKLVDPSVISDFNLIVIKGVSDGYTYVVPVQATFNTISAQDPANISSGNIYNTTDITAGLVEDEEKYLLLLPSNGSYAHGTRK